MESVLAVISIATFAALTPGPNNFIVMQAASKQGLSTALTMVVGVVTGSMVLSFLAWLGLSSIVKSLPQFLNLTTLVGASYLIYIGSQMIAEALTQPSLHQTTNGVEVEDHAMSARLHFSFKGVFLFQFVNPKALLLVSTLSAELGRAYQPQLALVILLTTIACVSFASLCIWAWFGNALSHHLEQKNVRLMFNIVMGLMLMLPASFLLFKTVLLL